MTHSSSTAASSLRAARSGPLKGTLRVPGDKSISHRALILGGMSVGETRITGLLEGDDVLRTAAAMAALGATVDRTGTGAWTVHGRGVGGLAEPEQLLDLGNSGTGARLLMGAVATHPFTTFFTGDRSLCRRPMGRISKPLEEMGARFVSRSGQRLPLAVQGTATPVPIRYRLPVASAQVKSAVLLAGLNTQGDTFVIEPEPTRDHTENMLRAFGATVEVTDGRDGRVVRLVGQPELTGQIVPVPADPSSAAFFAVAAAIVPGSDLLLTDVGINHLRAGLFETLRDMGVQIEMLNLRDLAGEPVADIRVRAGILRGIEVPPERAPRMIDEYPVLAIAAAAAEGRTVMRGLQELRVKESDRLAAVARGLKATGIQVEELPDGLIIQGTGGALPGGGLIATESDHRIAMSFLIMGMASRNPVTIDDDSMIATSFPGFADLARGAGADLGAPR